MQWQEWVNRLRQSGWLHAMSLAGCHFLSLVVTYSETAVKWFILGSIGQRFRKVALFQIRSRNNNPTSSGPTLFTFSLSTEAVLSVLLSFWIPSSSSHCQCFKMRILTSIGKQTEVSTGQLQFVPVVLVMQLLLLWGVVFLTKMQFICPRPTPGPPSLNNCHCYEVLTTNIKG